MHSIRVVIGLELTVFTTGLHSLCSFIALPLLAIDSSGLFTVDIRWFGWINLANDSHLLLNVCRTACIVYVSATTQPHSWMPYLSHHRRNENNNSTEWMRRKSAGSVVLTSQHTLSRWCWNVSTYRIYKTNWTKILPHALAVSLFYSDLINPYFWLSSSFLFFGYFLFLTHIE